MTPNALLTFGWPKIITPDLSAPHFLERLQTMDTASLGRWAASSAAPDGVLNISALDRLFRRGPNGMAAIRQLVGLIGEKLSAWNAISRLQFECDAFAYAFLKQTYNYDVILPETPNQSGSFRDRIGSLKTTLDALKAFERDGCPIPQAIPTAAQDYLRIRTTLSRPSARLERVVLATLLINGPSKLDELESETGADTATALRILLGYAEPGYVTFEPTDESFCLGTQHLPSILFCLREKMGFDYLSALD
ncbi:MAG: hypothetical protein AAFQ58_11810 [Pseudomonadota bacterium]